MAPTVRNVIRQLGNYDIILALFGRDTTTLVVLLMDRLSSGDAKILTTFGKMKKWLRYIFEVIFGFIT